MSTPNQAYNSNQVPFGGFSVNMYYFPAQDYTTAPTLVGEYIMESGSPADTAVTGDRPDVDAGDNGWWLVNGKTEGPGTFQIATTATPTLKNGFLFVTTQFSTDTAGAGERRYFVVQNPSPVVSTTDYRKQNVTLREDKKNASIAAFAAAYAAMVEA